MSSAVTASGVRVTLRRNCSVARSGSAIGAVSTSASTASTSAVLVTFERDRAVSARAKLAFVRLRDERRHQLALADRPLRRAAHRFLEHLAEVIAEKVAAVLQHLHDVGHGMARDRADHDEQRLGAERVAIVQDAESHAWSFVGSRVASANAASATASWRDA